MHKFTGVFFKMEPGNGNRLPVISLAYRQLPALRQWKVILAYLVGLWQVGVKIIFPVKTRELADACPKGKRGSYGIFDDAAIDDGKGARLP
jgi:hypothetical protein